MSHQHPIAQQAALIKRIENDFSYHAPASAEVKESFVTIRSKCLELARLVVDKVPFGREQQNALTRLEEVMFHANAGLARNQPKEEGDQHT